MKNDNEMDRLRAARPTPPPPAHDHDARLARIVAGPGDPRLADRTTIGKAHPTRRWATRPRILAGSSLGLAGVVAGVVLAFSGSTVSPAFAITQNADGTVVVHLYRLGGIKPATVKLNAEGVAGVLEYGVWHGPAPVPGPFKCDTTPWDQGHQIEMLLGRDGTDVDPDGRTWHVVECGVFASSGGTFKDFTPVPTTANTGSTGASTNVTTVGTSTNVTTVGTSTNVTTVGTSTNGAG